jgi:hypothetical protein
LAQGRFSLLLALEVTIFRRPPQINTKLRALIRRISIEDPLWVVVFSEANLRRILRSYARYYNRASEHPSVYVVEEKRFC